MRLFLLSVSCLRVCILVCLCRHLLFQAGPSENALGWAWAISRELEFFGGRGGQGEVWRLAAGSRPAWRAEGSTPHPISEISNFGPLTRTAPQTPIPWDIRKRGQANASGRIR